jgi:NADPH:quinone reductase-like Zn-dependent oxidoreductase
MKAIRMHTQGGPELLAYEDAPKPALHPGDTRPRHRYVDNEDRINLGRNL